MKVLEFSGTYESDPFRDGLQRALGADYVVERELSGGGMSRVFVATDTALQRRVAIKVLAPDLAAGISVERFRREILTSAALQHPHIVGVVSSGEMAGIPYFIMPFVDGPSLRTRLKAGPMPVREAIGILRDVARALDFAHSRGVVHRDIKPDNILLSGNAATVTDFGVAKALSTARGDTRKRDADSTLTSAGTSLGTPAYMAPEQIAADPDLDHRVDLYALGVVAYEMLTGQPPFVANSRRELLAAQLTEKPRSIATARPDVPERLDALVMQCLEKRPTDRPASAHAVIETLEDPSVASGDFAGLSAPHRARARAQRRLVVGGLVVVFSAIAVWQWPGRAGAAPVDPRSVAVLPIVDLTSGDSAPSVARGLTEALRSALGGTPGVTVASDVAMAGVTGGMAPAAIGRQLHVSNFVEASVQREGKRFQLAARLVSTNDGLSIWADVFESESKSVLDFERTAASAMAASISRAVTERVQATATPQGK